MTPERLMRQVLEEAADVVDRTAALGVVNEQATAELADASRLIRSAAGTIGGHLKAVGS